MAAPPRSLRPFVLLEVGVALSATGNAASYVAFPWLVLQATGSARDASLVAAAAAVPLVVAPVFAGVVVDLVGRVRVAVASDLVSAASIAAVALLATADALQLALIALFAAVGAVFDPSGTTARETMLPVAARAAGVPLERVNGIHEATFRVAYLAGPGLAGLLIAGVGVTATFWCAAAVLVLAAAVTAAVPDGGGDTRDQVRPDQGLGAAVLAGLLHIWRVPALRVLALVTAVVYGAWFPIEGVVLPVHFTELDDPAGLGLTLAAMSGGAIVGALTYGAVGHRVGRPIAYRVTLLGASVVILGMAFLPPLPALALLGVAAGAAYGPVDPIVNTVLQTRTPEHLRGRVLGAFTSVAMAAGPVGLVVVGPAITAFGLRPTFLVLAGTILAVSLVALVHPSVGRL